MGLKPRHMLAAVFLENLRRDGAANRRLVVTDSFRERRRAGGGGGGGKRDLGAGRGVWPRYGMRGSKAEGVLL